MFSYVRLALSTLRQVARARRDLVLENAALRWQLAMYERRPAIRDGDRLFWMALAACWSDSRDALMVVRSETLVRWHRSAWRR